MTDYGVDRTTEWSGPRLVVALLLTAALASCGGSGDLELSAGEAASQLAVQPIFTDGFNRTTGLGSAWRVAHGAFSTDGAAAIGTAAGSYAFWIGSPPADVAVSALVGPAVFDTYVGVTARGAAAAPDRDHYAAYVAPGGSIGLSRRTAYSYLTLGTAARPAPGVHRLSLSVTGSKPAVLSVAIDGVEVIHASDASGLGAGLAGIFDYNGVRAPLDDLTIAPTAAAPPLFDAATAKAALALAGEKLARTASVTAGDRYPKSTRADGSWNTVLNTNLTEWTQGFFPGSLWSIYRYNRDAAFRARADAWTRNLELQKTNQLTHDLGFKLYGSFGAAYQETADPYYRDVLLVAASSLASRYRPIAGVIDCCDWNPAWKLPMVIDTMMNLELLLWAADNGGQAEWRAMAISHALQTMSLLVRPDGSTYHVVDFDPATGAVRFKGTFQGYSDSSTWTRGQAWAIYGFTMVYRYTHDQRMLETARKTADYYLGRLGADMVPNWDFDAPQQSKDSSAAAAVASALLELSTLDPIAANQARYRAAALQMLASLSSPDYLAPIGPMSALLLHGVANYPTQVDVDVGLIYGDYYYLEALNRFLGPPAPPPSGFSDDFSRVGSLGASWSVATGSYVCDGSAAKGVAAQSFAFWTGAPGANDTVSVTLAAPLSATTAGVTLRANPAAPTRDHYRAYLGTDRRVHLARRRSWSYAYLADGPQVSAATHTLSATATGAGPVVLSVRIDGVEVIRFSDASTSAFTAAGRAGMFDVNGAGQRIDRFTVGP